MQVKDKQSTDAHNAFSPQDYSRAQLAMATLMDRIASLSQEAANDFLAVAKELLTNCDSKEKFEEITETIREILFPGETGGIVYVESEEHTTPSNLGKMMNHVGGELKKIRTRAGLTQEQLSQKSGIPQSHICRLEKGQHSPSHKTLQRLAQALRITVGELNPCYE